MIKRYVFILVSVITIFNVAFAAQPYTYTAQDVLAFSRITSVVASPDGKQVALATYNRSKANPANWRFTLSLRNENGRMTELTNADYIGSVTWSPDGKSIGYLAAKNGQQILAIYQLSTKETLPIVSLQRSIDAFKWSHSGKQIVFVADQGIKKNPTPILTNVANGVVNSRLYLIRNIHSDAFFKPITPANISISNTVFGGGFDWSANDQEIAFNYQPSAKAIDSSKAKVAIVNLTTLKTTTLPFCETHACSTPMYSPNGQWLAFEANILASGPAKALLEDIGTQNQICLMNQTGQTHCLQNTFNTTPYLFAWKANSQAVLVGDTYKAEGPKLYELNLDPKVSVKLIVIPDGFLEPATLSMNNTNKFLGVGYESTNKAPEAFIASVNDFKLTQITHINERFNKPLGQVQVLNWQSTDGTPIEGLLTTPPNYDPSRKYPLYVEIHGGPIEAAAKRYLGGCNEFVVLMPSTSCLGNILSLGYLILQVNYRGSTGYGLDFRVKNFRDFGGGDYHDIMTGIDYVVQKGIVDPNKIDIAGWSYGGFLTTWAISQIHRFHAAIDGDGFTDFISYTGTSNDTDFFYRYLGAYFWNDNQKLYWDRSPIAHVKNIATPLLILQGAQDTRVPPSQSQELYTALTMQHEPVKMLMAANQAHEPTDPSTISKEIEAIDQWLQTDVADVTKK